jgi:hypothetical protein
MKTKLFALCCRVVLLVMLLAPTVALAARGEPEREPVDARLEGYPTNVTLEGGSTAMTWILLIISGALIFGGLFKDAKRSHLD